MGAARCSPAIQSMRPQAAQHRPRGCCPRPGIRLSGQEHRQPQQQQGRRARVCATLVTSPREEGAQAEGGRGARTAPRWLGQRILQRREQQGGHRVGPHHQQHQRRSAPDQLPERPGRTRCRGGARAGSRSAGRVDARAGRPGRRGCGRVTSRAESGQTTEPRRAEDERRRPGRAAPGPGRSPTSRARGEDGDRGGGICQGRSQMGAAGSMTVI